MIGLIFYQRRHEIGQPTVDMTSSLLWLSALSLYVYVFKVSLNHFLKVADVGTDQAPRRPGTVVLQRNSILSHEARGRQRDVRGNL